MKRFALIAAMMAAMLMCASCEEELVQEEDVVWYQYKNSLYYRFGCSNAFSPEFINPSDEDAKWIVDAYWPKRRTHYLVQFAKLKDAKEFIKKYESFVKDLPAPSKIKKDTSILDETSLEISHLMRDYVLEEDNRPGLDNWEDGTTGERRKVALPVYGLKK